MSWRPSVLLLGCLLLTACTGVSGARLPSPTLVHGPTAEPTPSPTASPSPSPTPIPTPSASPSPTPSPSPVDGVPVLALDAIGCPGGVVLDWSATDDPGFHHYTALRSPETAIAPDYPPIAPAVDWGDTYATDPFVTSGADSSIIPSEASWNYRVMAYDASNRVLAASPVRSARLFPIDDLGTLTVAPVDDRDGGTRLDWRSFAGDPECFSSYRVLFATDGATPTTLLSAISNQSSSELRTDALHPDTTYSLRIQAVRHTTLGSFVVAQTDVAEYTVP